MWARGLSLFAVVVAVQVIFARVPTSGTTKRRLQHALTGHILVQISYVVPRGLGIALLLLGSAGIFVLQKYFPVAFLRMFGPLLRPSESSGERLPGAFYFLLGTAAASILVDDSAIVRYALDCLAFADPIASWAGSSIDSPRINGGTSVAGSAACFAAALVVGLLMLGVDEIRASAVGATACTIAEALPFGDDNFNIPVLTVLSVRYFGLPPVG